MSGPFGSPDGESMMDKALRVQASLRRIREALKAGEMAPDEARKASIDLMRELMGSERSPKLSVDIGDAYRGALFALGEEELGTNILGCWVQSMGDSHVGIAFAAKPGFDLDEESVAKRPVMKQALIAAMRAKGMRVIFEEDGTMVIEQYLDQMGNTCTDPSHNHGVGPEYGVDIESEVANFMESFKSTFGPAVGGRPLPPPKRLSEPPRPLTEPPTSGWSDRWISPS